MGRPIGHLPDTASRDARSASLLAYAPQVHTARLYCMAIVWILSGFELLVGLFVVYPRLNDVAPAGLWMIYG